jgi:hypothetical protein
MITVPASANTFTVPNNINIAPGNHFTLASVFMHAGDTIRFNMLYSPSTGRSVDYGIIRINGAGPGIGVFLSRNSTNGAMTQTITAERTGQHVIEIRNRNTSGGSVLLNGNAVYTNRSVTHSARIRMDPFYAAHPNAVANITSIYGTATAEFRNNFGITFSLNGDVSTSSALDGNACPFTQGRDLCDPIPSRCRTVCNDHHKSAHRIIRILPVTNAYTLRVVGHALCADGHRPHGGWAGLPWGQVPRQTLVTTTWTPSEPLNFLIQHELSHNLGASDHLGNAECVMNENRVDFGVWCNTCVTAIFNNK